MNIFLGPPGTGKTTRLLSVVAQELSSGVSSDRIAFVAFTRKAAYEAKTRAMEQFHLSEDDLPWFRTLHSMAFKILGISRDQVMTDKDYSEIGQSIGMDFHNDVETDEDEFFLPIAPSDKLGRNCAYLEQIARLTLNTLNSVCQTQAIECYWSVQLYARTLMNYKCSRMKIDFTDMIEAFVSGQGSVPKFDVLIVDEAQDLTRLQWNMVEILMANSQRVYIAGDDDQAIYEWAGASVRTFLELQGTYEVLTKSYRLPQKVFNKATSILSRLRVRHQKEFVPRNETGELNFYHSLDQVDYSQGSWLILTRNRYTLGAICGVMKRLGFPYVLHGKSSVDNEHVKALVTWESLRKGEPVSYDRAKALSKKMWTPLSPDFFKDHTPEEQLNKSDFLKVGINLDEDWMTALKIPDTTREYLRSIRRHKESLLKWPRIVISTIHQAKGGEADNVLVVPDMSEACYRTMQVNPDIEGRVFYVAVTRAKHALHIVNPRTNRYYDLRS